MTPGRRPARGIRPDRQPDAGWPAAVEAAYARFADHCGGGGLSSLNRTGDGLISIGVRTLGIPPGLVTARIQQPAPHPADAVRRTP